MILPQLRICETHIIEESRYFPLLVCRIRYYHSGRLALPGDDVMTYFVIQVKNRRHDKLVNSLQTEAQDSENG